jgi:hypothetical protein
MTNKYYIRINCDLDLLKQFLSYIDKNTSIKWAGGEPAMYYSSRKIDGIFIDNDRMQYTSDLNRVLRDVYYLNNFKEITIENLSILNSKNLFYD